MIQARHIIPKPVDKALMAGPFASQQLRMNEVSKIRRLADSRGQQEDLEGTDPLPQVRRLQMEAVHRPGAVQGPTGGPHHLQAGPVVLRIMTQPFLAMALALVASLHDQNPLVIVTVLF